MCLIPNLHASDSMSLRPQAAAEAEEEEVAAGAVVDLRLHESVVILASASLSPSVGIRHQRSSPQL